MGNFRRDNQRDSGSRGGFGGSRGGFGGSRGGFGGNRGGSRGGFGGNRRPMEKHRAVCDSCKKSCEVPFKPTSGKPVYCSECFEKKGSPGNRNSGASEASTKQLDLINAKLDKIMHALKIKSSKDENSDDDDESDDDKSEE